MLGRTLLVLCERAFAWRWLGLKVRTADFCMPHTTHVSGELLAWNIQAPHKPVGTVHGAALPWLWRGLRRYLFSYRGSGGALWLKTNPLLVPRPTARLRSARILDDFRTPVLLGASVKAAMLETSRRHIQQESVQEPQLWLGAENVAAINRLCVRLTGRR